MKEGSSAIRSRLLSAHRAMLRADGIELAEQALAVMTTRKETREKLGSSAPTMKADALHPTIWQAASGRWESGHYSDAVQRAATALSGHVKDRTGGTSSATATWCRKPSRFRRLRRESHAFAGLATTTI